LRIDVSGTDDAYIVFRGRRWVRRFHNLSDRITVIHGQTNIHIEDAKDSRGEYVGQPPHVALIGDGDYYINGKKQTSRFSQGNHLGNSVGGDMDRVWWVRAGVFIVVCIFVFALIGCCEPAAPRKVRRAVQVEAHQSDLDSSQFPIVDHEDAADVQTA
jgi:hypothetical protein